MWHRACARSWDGGRESRAAYLADLLLADNEEFRAVWNEHEVGIRPHDVKRFVHPELGRLDLNCQSLLDPDQSRALLVHTAVPVSESYEKLQLLSVIGAQALHRRSCQAGTRGRPPSLGCWVGSIQSGGVNQGRPSRMATVQ